MERLDLQCEDRAYLCGRLLAELEAIQLASANYKLNRTLVDSFSGTASTAPASVFGRLLGLAQAHLTNLRKTKKGAFDGSQQRIEEIMARVRCQDGFPSTLTLKEQGVFWLGYYHHRAEARAAINMASGARADSETNAQSLGSSEGSNE
jgi:CRISPR-associated protein Csd1